MATDFSRILKKDGKREWAVIVGDAIKTAPPVNSP
jgi:hypothetical protein